MTMTRASSQRGFTLIETIVSIVVIGIALAGLAAVFGLGFARGADPLRERQALAIAEAYLEEALLQPYADPDGGPACGMPEANRTLFDNACDYHALANNGCIAVSAACPLLGTCACDLDGTPIDALAGFAITMAVTNATLGPPNVNALRVAVTVRTPGGINPLQLVGYKAQTP